MAAAKKITVVFFRADTGAEPVRDWLLDLLKTDRVRIGEDIRVVEFGWPIGMPVCRPLGGGLYEVRTTLKDRIARVIFSIDHGEMVFAARFHQENSCDSEGRFGSGASTPEGLSEGRTMKGAKKNPHRGSRFEDFLCEQGILDAVTAAAQKRVVTWQVLQLMEQQKLSKTEMAKRMKTSRAALERLLDPENPSVTLQTIGRAAAVLGRTVEIRLVKAA
jgi:DNA-binding Xre family transcriptional regulator/phage-related protein